MVQPLWKTVRVYLLRLNLHVPDSLQVILIAYIIPIGKYILKVKVLITHSCPALCNPMDKYIILYMIETVTNLRR